MPTAQVVSRIAPKNILVTTDFSQTSCASADSITRAREKS
jgi:hypothetical protein